jgi:hypothetical protein
LGHANRHALAWPTYLVPSPLLPFCPGRPPGERQHKAGNGMDEKEEESWRKKGGSIVKP